jgi:uncharacterized membrane protein HdeD (DUF308 family)
MTARKLADRIAIAAAGVLALIGLLAAFAALGGTQGSLGGIIAVAAGAVIYLFPSLTARRRHAPNTGSIVVVNVLAGWTVVGWVVAMAMAMRDPRPAA